MQGLPYMLGPECLTTLYSDSAIKLIERHFNLVTLKDVMGNSDLAQKIEAICIFYWEPRVTKDLLESLPKLKTVASAGVGVDHLDLPLLWSHGVSVSYTPDVVSAPTADMAMTLLLASARNLVDGVSLTKSQRFTAKDRSFVGVDVDGATLGILGMGRVGRLVAERARGFRMDILYHNRTRRPLDEETGLGAVYCQKLEELLEKCDFLMVTVTLNAESIKMIGRRELKLMKTNATIINVARGKVIDQEALVEALQNKWIRAAALDVTDPEPLPRDHPLLQLPNVIVTPHLGVDTEGARRAIVEAVVENALAGVQDRAIPCELSPRRA
ncbi:putative 2-ketogluconate reductase [Lampetra fluviatilis]